MKLHLMIQPSLISQPFNPYPTMPGLLELSTISFVQWFDSYEMMLKNSFQSGGFELGNGDFQI
jgi:hypothetical protein